MLTNKLDSYVIAASNLKLYIELANFSKFRDGNLIPHLEHLAATVGRNDNEKKVRHFCFIFFTQTK